MQRTVGPRLVPAGRPHLCVRQGMAQPATDASLRDIADAERFDDHRNHSGYVDRHRLGRRDAVNLQVLGVQRVHVERRARLERLEDLELDTSRGGHLHRAGLGAQLRVHGKLRRAADIRIIRGHASTVEHFGDYAESCARDSGVAGHLDRRGRRGHGSVNVPVLLL